MRVTNWFLMIQQPPGSDLRGSNRIETVHEPAFDPLRVAHCYSSLPSH